MNACITITDMADAGKHKPDDDSITTAHVKFMKVTKEADKSKGELQSRK